MMQFKPKEGFNRIALLAIDFNPQTEEINIYIDFHVDECRKSNIKMKGDFYDAVSDRIHEIAELVQYLGMIPSCDKKNKFYAVDLYRISNLQNHNVYTWDLKGWEKFQKNRGINE